MIPFKKEAYQLLHSGAIALSQVEANGMRIDVPYLKNAIKDTAQKIKDKRAELARSKVSKIWKKHFRQRTNYNSNDQLATVLFDLMGYVCENTTASGKHSTNEETLSTIDHPFVQSWLEIKKLEKAENTYLKGISNELVGDILRPVFNLHLANTYRSSCDSPNFQNIPVRIPWMKKLIRSAIIARPKRRLVSIDYRGIEVCIAACYHKDPNMIRYIEDKSKDMHRDMAAECYKLKPEQVTKMARYCAKNMFVFPQFYGSWYVDCAKHLWQAIKKHKLETVDGISLKKHLSDLGIKNMGACEPGEPPVPGTFEAHIQKVEKNFWGKRFPVYAQWKRDWFETYRKRGWMPTKTGFVLQGFMKRNEVINYPVQGSAFHCLLWSLIRLQLIELRAHKMKTLIIGQIHDSLENDSPEKEVDDFLHLANQVMTRDIRKHWKWINVPLEIEAEVSPVEGNWEEKEEYKF